MRMLLRLAAVVLIVTQLAGFSCYGLDDESIEYAPGYGYVVSVQEYEDGNKTEIVYYLFDTLEQAQGFVRDFKAKVSRVSKQSIPQGYHTAAYEEDSVPGREVARLKKPRYPLPDGGRINLTIDRAIPPLPTGPQPQ